MIFSIVRRVLGNFLIYTQHLKYEQLSPPASGGGRQQKTKNTADYTGMQYKWEGHTVQIYERKVNQTMKRKLSVFLALVMLLALAAPAASAAEATTLTEKYAQFDSQYLPAQWSYATYCYEECYAADPIVVDLDGDGKLEAITAAWTVTVADAASGSVKWQIPKSGRQVYCTPVAADLDGDGKLELIVGYGDGVVNVYSGAGQSKWTAKVSPWGDSVRSLAAADVDGDGKQEVIIGLGAKAESLYVYSHDGQPKPGCISGQIGTYSDSMWGNGLATGDMDGDGLPEIVMPTDNWFVNAFNGDGSLVMANSDVFQLSTHETVAKEGSIPWCAVGLYEDYEEEMTRENGGWGLGLDYDPLAEKGRAGTYGPTNGGNVARFVDVDGDGTQELVMTMLMTDRSNYFIKNVIDWMEPSDAKYMTVAIYNMDHTRFNNGTYNWEKIPTDQSAGLGAPLYSDASSASRGVEPVPVVADVNGDGVNEILFNSFDGKVHCFSLKDSQKELAGWPYKLPKTTSSQFELPSAVTCADLNGDGKQEVIFGSVLKNGSGEIVSNGAVYVVGGDGKLIASCDVHAGMEEGGVNQPNGVLAAPAVADVDKDGKFEILVNTRKYGLCAYQVNLAGGQTSEQDTGFVDVAADAYYAEPVKWAVAKGVTNGTGTNPATFSPNKTCTLAEIITFLHRAAGKPVSTAELPFTPKNAWAADALRWAYEKGMVDANSAEDIPCTRANAVRFIWLAFNAPEPTSTASFGDVPADAYYAKAVSWAVSKGITNGTNLGFEPDLVCNRAQIVTFLYRAYK